MKNNKFENKTYLVKDNFWTSNLPTTACSNFLQNFIPGEEATVIRLLKKKYKLEGKTTMDEFACGGTGLLANSGETKNPYNPEHIAGGSSSGSALAVANNTTDFSLGSDTGGSVRCPAAYCGIVGFKPSYGLVSRYGLIPMASSMDTVGILSNSVINTQKFFSVISQVDSKDLLTIVSRKKIFKTNISKLSSTQKIAIIEGLENFLSTPLKASYQNLINILKKKYIIEKIKFPKLLKENLQTCWIVSCFSELVSHLNSCQGITYGQNINNDFSSSDIEKKITKNRSQYLGKTVKKRLLIGAYFLQNPKYTEQAFLFRRKLKEWIDKIFFQYDLFIFPSKPAPKIEKEKSLLSLGDDNHWINNLILIANLTGIPSLSLPIDFVNKLPIAIYLNSAYGQDKFLLKFSIWLEKKINFNSKKNLFLSD